MYLRCARNLSLFSSTYQCDLHMVLSFLRRSAVAQGVGCCSAAVVALGVCSCSAALERSGVFAERSSVQLGSGSSGSGCRIGCGRGGSGRTLQRAAGQRHRRQWHTTIKRAEAERCSVQLGIGISGSGCRIGCGSGGSGRTLQRAAGQR